MDNTNLIMRAKIGVHNQGSIKIEVDGYSVEMVEKTRDELISDGYKAKILDTLEGKVLEVSRSE